MDSCPFFVVIRWLAGRTYPLVHPGMEEGGRMSSIRRSVVEISVLEKTPTDSILC
jgi:hypothetical protein